MLNYATGIGELGQNELAEGSTFLLGELMKNETFRTIFAGRFAHYLNTIFSEEVLHEKLAVFEELYEPEMARNIARWQTPASMEQWRLEVQEMREFGAVRDDYVFAHLLDYFDLAGYADLDFKVEKGHTIKLYDKEVPLKDGSWTGRYLTGLPVRITVDGSPARLEVREGPASVNEEGELVIEGAGEAVISIQSEDGEGVGEIRVKAADVAQGETSLQPGQTLDWPSAIGKGTYATVSNPMIAGVSGNTFTAESGGKVLLTVHNKNDQVTAMEWIIIE